jgi:predicted ArsR family transcriptional regulator
MQTTRENILNILKEHGQATVDELSAELGLTTVTVRHHLDILRGDGLVAAPIACRRKAPGRPKYVYALAEKASALFPKGYAQLASLMLDEANAHLPTHDVERMMRDIGERIAKQATLPKEGDFVDRLVAAVGFLDEMGYMAHWEHDDKGAYLLHIVNCPYEQVARKHHEVCTVDVSLLTHLLGTHPRRISWAVLGEHECTYVIQPSGA